MKIKMTKKEANQLNYVVRGGYCEFQNLLRYPFAKEVGYGCGIYGWNWDLFEIQVNNFECVYVCTGYRDMTGKRIEGLNKFDKRAAKIWDWNNKISYDEKLKAHKRLIKEFANYIIEHWED